MKVPAAIAVGISLLLSSATARAQGDAKATELTFQVFSPPGSATWRVGAADAAGRLTLTREGPGDIAALAAEGYYLVIPVAEGPKAFARVLVEDVDDKAVTARTSPEAIRALGEGTAVRLVRPFPLTTRQIRSIPELVTLAGPTEDAAKAAKMAASRARSVNNLKQIALALHNYHAANDHLPPAVVRGPDGKPWHSWRVLILPYLEQARLYNQYDFSQPWDSPKNLQVLDKMPDVFRDPVYGDNKGHFTNYAALSGDGTLFPPEGMTMKGDGKVALGFEPDGKTTFADVTDGLSNTIAVAPVSPERKIPWTKPEDIRYDEDFPPLGEPKGIAAPYKINDVKAAPVMVMDGSVKMLSSRTEPPMLHALITRAGGEIVPADVFGPAGGRGGPAGMATITVRIEGGKGTATIR